MNNLAYTSHDVAEIGPKVEEKIREMTSCPGTISADWESAWLHWRESQTKFLVTKYFLSKQLVGGAQDYLRSHLPRWMRRILRFVWLHFVSRIAYAVYVRIKGNRG